MVMTDARRSAVSQADRRASRRRSLRSNIRVECRKGSFGLGRNLVKQFLDVSETGIRLLLGSELPRGQEAEILLEVGYQAKAIKRLANVIWVVPTGDGSCCVGLRFQTPLK